MAILEKDRLRAEKEINKVNHLTMCFNILYSLPEISVNEAPGIHIEIDPEIMRVVEPFHRPNDKKFLWHMPSINMAPFFEVYHGSIDGYPIFPDPCCMANKPCASNFFEAAIANWVIEKVQREHDDFIETEIKKRGF